MSNGEVRKVSLQDIQLVQNLIERCLQLYMSQSEVVNTLLNHAKIEPGITEIVWEKLEEENPEFFRAYHLRLTVKDHILRFNQLLEKQVQLMKQFCPVGVASVPPSNGSQIHSMPNNSGYQAPYHPVGNMQPANTPITNLYTNGVSSRMQVAGNMHPANTPITNLYTNGVSSRMQVAGNMHPANTPITNLYANGVSSRMQVAGNMEGHAGRIPFPENIPLAQNSNAGMIHGMNGGMVKPGGHMGNSLFTFGADNSLLETRNPPHIGGNPSLQTLNDLESEMDSFGILAELPENMSFSDLTADDSNSNDILGSYSRSPIMGADANFLDPQIRGEQQGIGHSERLTCEDFSRFNDRQGQFHLEKRIL